MQVTFLYVAAALLTYEFTIIFISSFNNEFGVKAQYSHKVCCILLHAKLINFLRNLLRTITKLYIHIMATLYRANPL